MSKAKNEIPKTVVYGTCFVAAIVTFSLIKSVLALSTIGLVGGLVWIRASKPPMEFKEGPFMPLSEPSPQRRRYLKVKDIDDDERRAA